MEGAKAVSGMARGLKGYKPVALKSLVISLCVLDQTLEKMILKRALVRFFVFVLVQK